MVFVGMPKSLFVLVFGICDIFAFNINTENARIYEGNKGSLFGFSMELLEFNSTVW